MVIRMFYVKAVNILIIIPEFFLKHFIIYPWLTDSTDNLKWPLRIAEIIAGISRLSFCIIIDITDYSLFTAGYFHSSL
jgi:hypothetical protein